MLIYNTQQKKLILPEYGRNIQQMVEYCKTIEDRDERNYCARSIIRSMGNLFPELRDAPDSMHKLWDHLAIMSDFELDIDYPFEPVDQDKLHSRPGVIDYNNHQSEMRYRHYGIHIQHMIEVASEMPDGDERNEFVRLLANQMKKDMLAVNREGVDDDKIFADLMELSRGRININPGEMRLHEFREAPQPQNSKKKKKKNNN